MKIWYEITPLDTLFFRGNEPLEAGQASSAPLFPPPVSVVQGALRTTVLRERGISMHDYKQGSVPEEIISHIGMCGAEAPFSVTAILLKHKNIIYAPAPANWFIDTSEKLDSAKEFIGKSVIVASSSTSDAAAMGIVSSSGNVSLVLARQEAVSLAGCWVNTELFSQKSVTFGLNDLLFAADLYSVENRTGIEIDGSRKVVEGKLYSANHIRLRDEVTLLIATDKCSGLAESGILQLGGEQRKSRYEQLPDPLGFQHTAAAIQFVSLAPVEATLERLGSLVASQKPVITAGWDLSKGFHKPSMAWFPAGTVFTVKISNACIPLAL